MPIVCDVILDTQMRLQHGLFARELKKVYADADKQSKDFVKRSSSMYDSMFSDVVSFGEGAFKTLGESVKGLLGPYGFLIDVLVKVSGLFRGFLGDAGKATALFDEFASTVNESAGGMYNLVKATNEVSMITGVSYENVQKAASALIEYGYAVGRSSEEIVRATTAISQFSRATGVGADVLADLRMKFEVVGKAALEYERHIAGMIAVSKKYGLTAQHLSTVISSMSDAIINIKFLYGVRGVEQYGKALLQMAAAARKAGVDLSVASQLMQELTANSMQYVVLLGGAAVFGTIEDKMRALRARVPIIRKQMEGIPIGIREQVMRQLYGIDSQQLAVLEKAIEHEKEFNKIMSEIGGGAGDISEEYERATSTIGSAWERLTNRLRAYYMRFVIPISKVITVVAQDAVRMLDRIMNRIMAMFGPTDKLGTTVEEKLLAAWKKIGPVVENLLHLIVSMLEPAVTNIVNWLGGGGIDRMLDKAILYVETLGSWLDNLVVIRDLCVGIYNILSMFSRPLRMATNAFITGIGLVGFTITKLMMTKPIRAALWLLGYDIDEKAANDAISKNVTMVEEGFAGIGENAVGFFEDAADAGKNFYDVAVGSNQKYAKELRASVESIKNQYKRSMAESKAAVDSLNDSLNKTNAALSTQQESINKINKQFIGGYVTFEFFAELNRLSLETQEQQSEAMKRYEEYVNKISGASDKLKEQLLGTMHGTVDFKLFTELNRLSLETQEQQSEAMKSYEEYVNKISGVNDKLKEQMLGTMHERVGPGAYVGLREGVEVNKPPSVSEEERKGRINQTVAESRTKVEMSNELKNVTEKMAETAAKTNAKSEELVSLIRSLYSVINNNLPDINSKMSVSPVHELNAYV